MARGQDTSRDASRTAHQDLMARNAGQVQPTAGAGSSWESQVGVRQNPESDRPNSKDSQWRAAKQAERAKEDEIGRRWHATADAAPGAQRRREETTARAGGGTIARNADRNRTVPLVVARPGASTPDDVRAASQTGNYEPAIRQSRDMQRYLGTESTRTITEQRGRVTGVGKNEPTSGVVFDRKTGEASSTGRDEERALVRGDVSYPHSQSDVQQSHRKDAEGRYKFAQSGAIPSPRVLQEEVRSDVPGRGVGAFQTGFRTPLASPRQRGAPEPTQTNPDPDPAFGASSSIKRGRPAKEVRTLTKYEKGKDGSGKNDFYDVDIKTVKPSNNERTSIPKSTGGAGPRQKQRTQDLITKAWNTAGGTKVKAAIDSGRNPVERKAALKSLAGVDAGSGKRTTSIPKQTFAGDTPDSPRQYISRPRIVEGKTGNYAGKPEAVLQAVEMMNDTTEGIRGLTQVQTKERMAPKLASSGKTPAETGETAKDKTKSYSDAAKNPVPNSPVATVDPETGFFPATDKKLPGPKKEAVGVSARTRKRKIGKPAADARQQPVAKSPVRSKRFNEELAAKRMAEQDAARGEPDSILKGPKPYVAPTGEQPERKPTPPLSGYSADPGDPAGTAPKIRGKAPKGKKE